MNAFALSSYSTAIATFLIGSFVFLRNRRSELNRIFFFYSSAIAIWAFLTAAHSVTASKTASLFCARFMHVLVPLIPVLFFHFILTLLNLKSDKRYIFFLKAGYFFAVAIGVVSLTTNLIVLDVRPKLGYLCFMDPGILYVPVIVLFSVFSCYGLLPVFLELRKSSGARKRQFAYLFWSSLVGYAFGASNFLPVYDLTFFPYPYGSLGITLYVFAFAYAVLKHGLLDIQVILKNTLVFAGLFFVLIAVLGVITVITQSYIGQYLGMGQTAQQILSILIVIVLFDPTRKLLTNLTDKFLFQKKYDYHKLLKDASRGMSNIESLEHLLGLVVHFITMKMRVKNAAVLMREGASDQYQLIYQRGFDKKFLTLTLYQNDPLIHYLENHKEAVDIERVKEQVEAASHSRDKSDKQYDFEAIRERMNQLQASCCVPSFLGRELRNILMLGEKKSALMTRFIP